MLRPRGCEALIILRKLMIGLASSKPRLTVGMIHVRMATDIWTS